MKKKIIYIVIAVVIVIVIAITTIVIMNNKQVDRVTVNGDTTTIRSTIDNPIEKEGIVIPTVEIRKAGIDLEVVANLKNTTKEEINGFFFEIKLFDKEGKEVTMVAENSSKVLKPGEVYIFKSSVAGLESLPDIRSAEFGTLTLNTNN